MKKPIDSNKLLGQLANDPEYAALMADRERKRLKFANARKKEMKPIVDAISAVWRRIEWIDDLVHTKESYPEAIPILVEHLQLPYHLAIKDGIARALTCREARGAPAKVVMQELKTLSHPKKDEELYQFALVNALVVIGDSSMKADIVGMIQNPGYAKVRGDLKRALKAVVKR